MLDKTVLQSRKELGLAHLNADRIEEGLKIYAMILRDYPEDVESYIVIGDCYLAQGEDDTAVQLYAYALELSPGNVEIMRRLRLAKADKDLQNDDDAAMPDLRTIGRLLQRIMGQQGSSVTETEIQSALTLLEEIRLSPKPALTVAERLADIEELIPALLELNVRQARSEGKPDLAMALDGLVLSVREQLSMPREDVSLGQGQKGMRILFLIPAAYQISSRALLAAKSLAARGFHASMATKGMDVYDKFDIAIAFNPHGEEAMMEIMAACSGAKIPILLDLDNDFEQMPVNHSGFADFGLESAEKMRAFTASLVLADGIITPHKILAEKFQTASNKVYVIQDGWARREGQWEKPLVKRHTVNLGWIGLPGQVEDVALIRRMVYRILREFPHTQLVIGGDIDVYQLFDHLPESRRMFLPPAQPEDYPYQLGQVDIFLSPLQDSPFNQTRSDQQLMEAGARRIPWVASPIPAYKEWNAGGLVANSAEEWVSHLRRLVLEPELRNKLGQEGWRKSETREMTYISDLWQQVIREVLQKAIKFS